MASDRTTKHSKMRKRNVARSSDTDSDRDSEPRKVDSTNDEQLSTLQKFLTRFGTTCVLVLIFVVILCLGHFAVAVALLSVQVCFCGKS